MTEQIAVIGVDGTIEWVNEAWTAFSKENGGALEKTCPGINYLEVCRRSADSGEKAASVMLSRNGGPYSISSTPATVPMKSDGS